MPRTGIALVVSAPSGAGKTTLTSRLCTEYPTLSYSISCTTRKAREGEVDGIAYHFMDTATFMKKRDEGYFAEWAIVHNNFYGTPLAPVQKALAQGKDILFDIDVQGAKQLKKTLPEALFVFILPPSMAELEKRLRKRGQDSEETIATRLNNAYSELMEAHWYDALIVNDRVEEAYTKLVCVFNAARCATQRNRESIDVLLAERKRDG
ncbi:MAG: guanylate kinase [Desulfovibrionaceae bacterium]|nr:guanylate kinase [Desulfovibrionaceae bacterium]